jgi:HK97 family phage major capsid protein
MLTASFDFASAAEKSTSGFDSAVYESKLRNKLRSLGDKVDPTEDDVALVDRLLEELNSLPGYRAARVAYLEQQVASGDLHCEPAVPGSAGFNVSFRGNPWEDRGLESHADILGRAREAVSRAAAHDVEGRGECATRILERAETPSAFAQYMIDVSDPTYFSAFGKVAMFGEGGAAVRMSDAERASMLRAQKSARALSISTGTAGHFAVPFELDPTVVLTNDGTLNPIRSVARVEKVVTDVWHSVSSAGVTAEWKAEGVAAGDNSPTLAQPDVEVHKAAAFVPMSLEIEGDWANIATEVAKMIGDAKARLESAAFATGSGNGQPRGVVTALDANTNVEVAVTTNNALGAVDIFHLYESLPPRYRADARSACWLMNTPYINLIRQFGTAVNSTFTVDFTEDGIPRLLGRKVLESSEMDAGIGTGTDPAIVIGDFSNYVIADRVGLSIELIPHLFDVTNNRPTGQRGWYAWWRVGGDSINDLGFRLLLV